MPLSLAIRGRARVSAAEQRLVVRLVARALQAAGVADGELALSLSDDGELRRLNQDYAGADHATDVLSFSQPEAEGRPPLLGDVIISVPMARRQARAGRHPLADELVHLAVHGLAHLLGFDHRTPAEERVMFGYEARLRQAARAPGPVRRIARPRQRIRSA